MKLNIILCVALILLLSLINLIETAKFKATSKAELAMHTTAYSRWRWKSYGGWISDISINSFDEIAAVGGRGTVWGWDALTWKWKQYPGRRTGVRTIAFSNENVVWVCRGNVIEKFVPFHSYRFHGKWIRIPGCCRDVDVGANNFVAVIGCDNHRWGNGIWRNLGGNNRRWARIPGQADNIGLGPRGQLAVRNRGRRLFWKYKWNSRWIMTSGLGYDITVTSGGRMMVIGLDHHVWWSRKPGPRPSWVKNNGMGFRVTAWSWRYPVVVGMNHAYWHAIR